MDAFFFGNSSATFPNFGSSLGRVTSMEKPPAAPGWLCGEFRDELYAEKALLAFRSHIWDSQDPTGRVRRNQEKNVEKP